MLTWLLSHVYCGYDNRLPNIDNKCVFTLYINHAHLYPHNGF